MSAPEDADQRTLPPTERRLSEMRKRGEIALSREVSMVAALVGGAATLLATGGGSFGALGTFTRGAMASPEVAELKTPLVAAADTFVAACWPVAAGAMVGWLISAAVQVGSPQALKWPSFDLAKVFNPAALGELLSPKAMLKRALPPAAKVIVALAITAAAVHAEYLRLLASPDLSAPALALRVGEAMFRIVTWTGGALVALAALDYILARRSFMARARMTPEEMKREYREQEGDPQIKRRRRQRMRELAKRRLVTAVKTADVVLVNPTEYAVALRYKQGEDGAPRVVAKGRHGAAERIRELARNAGIPVVPSPPLCRMIYKLVPEGREIPAKLYKAVAEVLAYVYRLKQKRGSR